MTENFIEARGPVEIRGERARAEVRAEPLERGDETGEGVVERGTGAADAGPNVPGTASEAQGIGKAGTGERGGGIARTFKDGFGQGNRGELG